jgi:UDP-N-acetylmuramate dehydrogenase
MIKTEYYKDLTKMNTFGMKVKARCFIEYDSVADLVEIEFEELARPVLHIGRGSNLLFTDDLKGTVLHSKIDFIEILDEPSNEVLVSVGAGVVFDDFCAWAAKEGLWGVENLSYIPGEVGASAVQNIGAYGVEVKDVIRRVYCYDTVEEEFVNFSVEECGYGYRDSIFKDPEVKGRYIVTHVVFALSRVPQPKLEYGHLKDAFAEVASSSLTPDLIRKTIIKIRKEKLPEPSVKGSAGSFFKNPVVSMADFQRIEASAKAELGADYMVPHYDLPDGTVKVPAAWMIEQCGWKGKRSGGAAVWDKQPLVIVNHTGDAYPEEIVGLEKRIIASVRTKFGVELSPEVEHV